MQRPPGITIIAILGFILAAVAIFEALLMLRQGMMAGNAASFYGTMAGHGMAFYGGAGGAGVVLLFGAALVIFTCVGLLNMREWARVLAIVLNAVHLVIAALGLLDAFRNLHMPFFVGMMLRHIVMLAIGACIIVYLLRPDVKRAFGSRTPMAT
jgi:hypothetical protein